MSRTQLRRDIYIHRRATSGIPNLHCTVTTARGQEGCARECTTHRNTLNNYYYHNTTNNDCALSLNNQDVGHIVMGKRVISIEIDIARQKPPRT